MESQKAYIVGIHHACPRVGVPGEIIGVKFVKPNEGLYERLCYVVMWHDFIEDEIPVSDIENGSYIVITFDDVLSGRFKIKG